ncbi:MAG: iron transporter [Desulfobacterales bacterium]|nr:iron transporter [Desulfobacterales bacterium]
MANISPAGASVRAKTGHALKAGFEKGWRGYFWLLKILVPISFATFLLDTSGWLHHLDFLLAPVMDLMRLPPEAALVLLVGMATGIYGAVAAMAVLPLTQAHMTLIAVFLLISHNLVQEGIIQGKSGFHPFKATVVRLITSMATVIAVGFFLEPSGPAALAGAAPVAADPAFLTLLSAWVIQTVILAAKIFGIILALMAVLELMKSFDLMDILVRRLSPVLKLMGLPPQVGFLWLAAGLFGISYGAAVIVEETRGGRYDPDDLNRLHVSIGINHAMVEDPALFLALGIGAFWLWVPRIIAAIAAVYFFSLWARGRKRVRSLAAHRSAGAH